MKHLIMSMYLLLTAAIFTGCEKETTTLPENAEMNVQDTKIIDQDSYKSLHEMIMAGVDMESYYKSLPEQNGKISKQSTSQITEYPGVEFYYESEAGFDFPCNNMPTEDFNSADVSINSYAPPIGITLDTNTDNGYFSPGDILPGISLTSDANLNLWYYSNWGADKLIFIVNYGELIINFTSTNVTSVRMKIAQVATPGYTNIGIAVYGFSDNLLGTSGVYIQPYGINWGVITSEPIKKIILTGYYPGVDNVSFGNCDDIDGDGVLNEDDLCANTPSGEEVNSNGCAESQLDDDNDGVMNDLDTCSNTPSGEAVNQNGCGQSQLDYDGDGVMNNKDAHIYSNMSNYINIGGFYPNVKNKLVRNGSTMMDQITDLIHEINAEYNGHNYEYLHRKFLMLLERKATDWRRNRLITNRERDAISRSAASALIPYTDES